MIILEYFNLIIFFLLIFIFSLFLISVTFLTTYNSNYSEKIAAYECGLNTFEYHISNYEVRYYLIGILFLIFDLEIVLLLPWIYSLNFIGNPGNLFLFIFIIFLILGYLYEFKIKCLNLI